MPRRGMLKQIPRGKTQFILSATVDSKSMAKKNTKEEYAKIINFFATLLKLVYLNKNTNFENPVFINFNNFLNTTMKKKRPG